ncbi:MAG: glycosyltransferase [Candidatus Methanoperedens sp.]|nr:glycosyltransferase [Candidatus Methanoperedens sp.]
MKDANIYDAEIDYCNKNTAYSKEIDLIGHNKRVLEFGCATGYVSKILEQRGCRVTGIEMDENAAKKASIYCEKIIIADIDIIELKEELKDNKFEVILFGDILEHLKNPKRILLQAKDFLSKDGYIVISIPNVAHWSIRMDLLFGNFDYQNLGLLDDSHLRFFTKKSIVSLLESCGYFIDSIDYSKQEVDWVKVDTVLKMKGFNEIDAKKILTMFNDMDAEAYQYVIKAVVCSEDKYLEKISSEKVLLEEKLKEKNISIAEKDKQIEELHEIIQTKEKNTHDLEITIAEKDKQIAEFHEIIQTKEKNTQDLEITIAEKDKQIVELHEIIQTKEKNTQDLEITIAERENKLDDIYSSTTWKVLTKYQRLVDIILPPRTKRRHGYDLGIICIRILINDGFGTLLSRFKQRTSRSNKSHSKIPILETKIASSYVPLSLDKILCGKFTFPLSNLNEVRIFTATYLQRNSNLMLEITNSEGKILRTGSAKGDKIKNNDYTSFRFEPIKNSKGQSFFFKLRSKKKPSAAVWYDRSTNSSELTLFHDDEQINGSINFQAFSDQVLTPYELWILKNEPAQGELIKQKEASREFNYRPVISIITPVYDPPPAILEATIESVLNQTYDNWEICLVDGGSKNKEIQTIMENYAQKESRVKIRFLERNLGISGNSNIALNLAKGEFIALLDHDDLLAPFALFEVVKSLNENPDLDFIYSDKDLVSENGKQRFEPLFKPDWSPEIMLSANYLTHLCILRRTILDAVGNFLTETDGAQDWDLFLRVTEKTKKIYHIPKVLYHWRESNTSCAQRGAEAKPYIYDAQRIVIQHHLRRRGLLAKATLIPPAIWRIKWLVTRKNKISIIIPTRDNLNMLKSCVESILDKSLYKDFEIIIIDTGTKEPKCLRYYNELSGNPKIKIIFYSKSFNYSIVNNLGVQHSTGEVLLFLNDDTEIITSDWLEEMKGFIEQKEIGVVGAKLIKPDNTIQHAGIVIGMNGFAGHIFAGIYENYGYTQWYRNYLAVTGACMMIRRQVFEEVGGFDESFILMGSDVDLCLRIVKNGYRIVYTPFAKLIHHEAATRSNYIPPQDFRMSFGCYKSFLEKGDPYYNINLSPWSSIPTIKLPGERKPIEVAQEVLKNAFKE